jgi:hypothetical protein
MLQTFGFVADSRVKPASSGMPIWTRMRPYSVTSLEKDLSGPRDGLVGGQSDPSTGAKSGSCAESACADPGVNVHASCSRWHVLHVRPFVPRFAKKPFVVTVAKSFVDVVACDGPWLPSSFSDGKPFD